jgi:hypothetical protein
MLPLCPKMALTLAITNILTIPRPNPPLSLHNLYNKQSNQPQLLNQLVRILHSPHIIGMIDSERPYRGSLVTRCLTVFF